VDVLPDGVLPEELAPEGDGGQPLPPGAVVDHETLQGGQVGQGEALPVEHAPVVVEPVQEIPLVEGHRPVVPGSGLRGEDGGGPGRAMHQAGLELHRIHPCPAGPGEGDLGSVHPEEEPPVLLPGLQDRADPPECGAEGFPGLGFGLLPPEEPAEDVPVDGPIPVEDEVGQETAGTACGERGERRIAAAHLQSAQEVDP
jgi:hypothetical protein